jgi:hypothetical protein
VAVERDPGAVVSHGGAGVGVAGCFLDVTEWDTGVEGGSDEGVAQGMGSDSFGDSGTAGDAAHDAGGGVTVEPVVVGSEEEWSFAAFTDHEVNCSSGTWCEWDETVLAPLRRMVRVRCPRSRPTLRCSHRWLRRHATR